MADYKESKPFYHTPAWRRVRAKALARDKGMCQDCMDRFRMGIGTKPRRATLVHHIDSIEERPDLALTLSNLRSACGTCHNRAHPEKGSARQEAKSASPYPRMRIIKI